MREVQVRKVCGEQRYAFLLPRVESSQHGQVAQYLAQLVTQLRPDRGNDDVEEPESGENFLGPDLGVQLDRFPEDSSSDVGGRGKQVPAVLVRGHETAQTHE